MQTSTRLLFLRRPLPAALLLFLLLLGCWGQAQAQAVTNYAVTSQTGQALASMSGATTVLSGGNNGTVIAAAAASPIGFTFTFGGTAYTQFWVNTRTELRFGNASPGTSIAFPTNANTPGLAPASGPYTTGSDGSVSYRLMGTAPNRVLVVNWQVGLSINTTATKQFQVWLSEGTNTIRFLYDIDFTHSSSGFGCGAGIATDANTYKCLDLANGTTSTSNVPEVAQRSPASGQSYLFDPAGSPTVTGFSPASGPAGSTVTVTGTNFTNVTSVRFGELSAAFTVNSTTQLTAIVPRAASTQVINVTTNTGSEISPTAFATTRSSSLTYALVTSNFAGVNVASNAAPAVGDLDGDGRLDLLVGRADGTIARYEQNSLNATAFTYIGLLTANGANIDRGSNATLAIVDTDSNGKFSVLVGATDGFVYDYEQTTVGSATFGLVNTNVGTVTTTTNSAPSVTNLDGDGRLELVVGKGDGLVSYFEQPLRNDPDFNRINSNYQALTSNSAPFCVDLDGNGRVDVLIGVAGGNIYRFEQSAAGNTTLNQITSNFNNISAGTNAKPCVTDIDGDGLLDLLVGRADGTIDRYEQTPLNTAPTALALSNSTVAENVAAGSTVGTFSTTDAEGGPFTYTLVSGGADNGSFSISGSTLTINASPNFEVKNSYLIQVRTTDPGGLTYERAFTIGIIDVPEVPTITSFTPTSGLVGANNIVISGTHFNDAGALTVKFNGTTATAFTVNSNTQLTATVPSGATTGTISVTNADGTGISTGTFTVTPANTAPTDISLTPSSVAENQPVNTSVGTLNTTDANAGNTFTYLFASGGADNGLFNIRNNTTLTTNRIFDFETRSTYTVRIRSTDQGGLSFEKDLTITVSNVVETPTVTGVNPTSGLPGTSGIVITGSNFSSAGAVTVRFNGALATVVTVNSDTQLTATVPTGATTGRITVQNADGTGTSPTDFTVPAPNTTIVSGPPSIGNSRNVSFQFSSDQSPVDYTTTGNPGFAYTGNGPNSTFGPLADGTYTLSAAARNTSTGLTDQSPATYTFTVDATAPTVAISSAAGASGGSTGTAPIPFAITFSETVSGFDVPDVSVTGGTFTASAVSATVYNISVTPTGPGSVVTVRVAANVATDAAGNGNAVSNTYSLTYAPPTPSTTIVSGPPSIGNSRNVSFQFSSDQSPVDYTTTGNPGFAYTGNGPNSTFGPLADGTYTLSVAARNTSTGVSDPTPATYTFTVDATAPTVMVSSPAAASGGRTLNSPIPFVITFSETVSGFDVPDVSVTGGTFTASAASGSVYNISVTPTGPGSVVTVRVAANGATDAAGNGNTASNTYSLTYAPVPTITSFTPTSGLAGTSVTITGTGFIGGVSVAFNGTSVMGLTGSSTQLNVSVPVGATTGFITVTTPSGTATSGTVFTVPANQAPVVTVPATQSTAFNTARVFSTANGNALSVADADAGSAPLAIYIQAVQGGITLASTTGLTITSGSNGAGSIGFTGTLTAINNALNGLSFSPNNGFSGTASVQLSADDQGNTGSGGAKSDSKTVTINVGTAAPVVSYPANGSTIASTTPTYSGTAPASSLVTVYVDNASIGTATATAGGSWGLLQPSALSQATHTVKATAQRSGAIVSGFGNVVSFTVDVTAPSVPVVSSPANGSFVGTLRPAYSGTGAGGSLITVYVDNVSVGTTTIAAGGSTWSFTQPSDLTQTTHTVKVTATDGVGNVSAFSATNTFTVDTTAPTVVVSSSAGASGGSTGTSPIPFVITYSESVSGFVTSDVSVTGGTFTAFAVSGTVYNISVTPTGPGSVVTVRVAANVATDAAGNGNTASNTYSLTYAPAPVITSLTPSSGPVGTSVVIAGSNFTGATGVTFNGTAAGSFTVNSSSQITALVAAGTSTGAVIVTTPSGTSNTNATFTVTAANTSTALTSNVNPSVFGQSVTFTATVTNTNGSAAPTGTVTFKDGSTTLGTGTIAGGVATYATSTLSVATHSITAVYGAATGFNASTSLVVSQVVNAAATSVALTSSLNPSTFGQSVTFTATVSATAPGTGTPTGTVTFKDGSTTLGTGTISSGVATYATSALTVGSHAITAVYGAATGYATSTSATLTQVVNPAAPVITSVAVPANGYYRRNLSLNFTVTFDQNVNVVGTPGLPLTVGTTMLTATYLSGSGTADLVFRYTVVNEIDTDGIDLGSVLALNGGTIRNATGTDALLTLNGVPSTTGVLVDGVSPQPTVTTTAPNPTTSSVIPITITFTEPVTGVSIFPINVTNGTKGPISGSGTTYTLNVTATASGPVTVRALPNTGQDLAGNPSTMSNTLSVTYAPPTVAISSFTPTSGAAGTVVVITGTGFSDATSVTINNGAVASYTVDSNTQITATVAAANTTGLIQVVAPAGTGTSNTNFVVGPAVTAVTATANGTYKAGQTLSFFVAFSQSVTVMGTPTLGLTVGSAARTLTYTGGSGTSSLTFSYVIMAGDLDTDGVQLSTGAIALNGGTIRNSGGADADLDLDNVVATTSLLVDAVAPTVAISSTATSPTNTAPIPVTVTFSESVTGFAATDVTVGNGSVTGGSFGGSGSTYTFTVTPTADGLVTVDVAANAAQDAATNGNTAAPQFSLTYATLVAGPTITSLSTSAELPGMPVVITGTGFTSGSTVRFGSTPAGSVTYTSATSLTAVVPAAAAVGSSTLVVTTNGVSSTSAPAFSVLKVYDAVANCLSTAGYLTTGDGQWHYLLAGGQVVAALRDTNPSLGTVSLDLRATGSAGPVRQDSKGAYYLDRNFHLTASGGPFTGSSVQVRFYGLTSEFDHLQAADASVSYAALKATQYSGPNEDCDLANNSGTGESRVLTLAASTPGGVAWFVAQATVADHFSEFYLTGSSAPLPVELVAFTAERRGSAVALAWRTASEKNSARFEVERSADGVAFAKIGQAAAQGNKATATDYNFRDGQPLASLAYYRLRQVDQDGTASYSPVRTVAGGPADQPALAAFPVPARAGQLLRVAYAPAGAGVELLDAVGRRVAQATSAADGTATLDLPRELATGVYVLRSGNAARRVVIE